MDVRTFLKEHTLIFDGAMGSYLMTKYHRPADGCELANLERPRAGQGGASGLSGFRLQCH